MKESRVTVLAATTISADGATNGSSIALTADYVGDHKFGTGDYGLPVEILAKSVVTGTGDGFTLTFKWQLAPDNAGSPGTWVDAGQIGVMTIDTDGNFVRDGAIYGLSRAKLYSKVRAGKGQDWARIVCTAAGITGGETVVVSASLADGAVDRVAAANIY